MGEAEATGGTLRAGYGDSQSHLIVDQTFTPLKGWVIS